MDSEFKLDLENVDWNPNARYPTAGFPPQPFKVILPAEIPRIFTPRLCLGIMREGDAEGLVTLRDIPENLRHIYGGSSADVSVENAREWMEFKKFTEPPSVEGRWLYFVITQRDDPTERIVGVVGFNRLAIAPNIGYNIQFDFWGKGYATEAMKGVLDWWWTLPREGEETSGKGRGKEVILALANKANIGSIRVLEKSGFQVYHEHFYEDIQETVSFLVVMRPEVV